MRHTFFRPSSSTVRSSHGGRGLLHCLRCGAVHYRKAWHHESRELYKLRHSGARPVDETICPACAMVRSHTYDGRVIIEHIPSHLRPDLINLVSAHGVRAWAKDPEERIVEIYRYRDGLVVTTTAAHLAVGLGKKIRDAFKKTDVDIRYAPKHSAETRVYVRFLPEALVTA